MRPAFAALSVALGLRAATASAQRPPAPVEVRCDPLAPGVSGVADRVAVATMRVPDTRALLRVTVTCAGVAPPRPPPAARRYVLIGAGATSFFLGALAVTGGASGLSASQPDLTGLGVIVVSGVVLTLAGVGMMIGGWSAPPPPTPRVTVWLAPGAAPVLGLAATF